MNHFVEILIDTLVIVITTLLSTIKELWMYAVSTLFPTYKDLTADVVLVTGGGNGLGRLLCLQFAKYCSTLIALDIDRDGLAETARLVLERRGKVLQTYVCDLRCRDQIVETAERVLSAVGRVTILVNNAGIVSGKMFSDLRPEDIENSFKINVLSHFYTIQAFLPSMIGVRTCSLIDQSGDGVEHKNARGHIVNIASVAGIVGGVGLSDYCATKAANLLMSESLELELEKMQLQDRIHVTRVCPFLLTTEMFRGCQPLRSWLFPIVDAEYCAHRIVDAVRTNEHEVFIYRRYAVFPVLKALLPAKTLKVLFHLGGSEHLVSHLQAARATQSVSGA
ncbi:hypothetical protein EG68_04598 [Paragonimus skrjabini miyazakii]|uniref:Uncharacterized protein n=1 Tax=Paragonimus skrjabini miyazakii TaxID=59628 RepID=A0A8S9Z3P7_9TREM|nr:hypothetical protein EG68_04598 [Paragonimus skrjabini miyazakii]